MRVELEHLRQVEEGFAVVGQEVRLGSEVDRLAGEPFRLVSASLPRKELGVRTSPDNLSRKVPVRREFATDPAEVPGLVRAILRVDRLGQIGGGAREQRRL